MKLIDVKGCHAWVYASMKITKKLDTGFPLSIGAVKITSADGNRSFILDSNWTEYENPRNVGRQLTFATKFEVDQETFPSKENDEKSDCNYDLLVEDLTTAKGLFFCSRQDMEEEGNGDLDYENANFQFHVYVVDRMIFVDLEIEE